MEVITAKSRGELQTKVTQTIEAWRRKNLLLDSKIEYIERMQLEKDMESWAKLGEKDRPWNYQAYQERLKESDWVWIAVFHLHS